MFWPFILLVLNYAKVSVQILVKDGSFRIRENLKDLQTLFD